MSELEELTETPNFENAATRVFERLILGKGPGLMVLRGGRENGPKANKTYFLNLVEKLAEGPEDFKPLVSESLWELFRKLRPGHYQCVRIDRDWPLPSDELYSSPISVVIPITMSEVVRKRGLVRGRNTVILCDDIHEFNKWHLQGNEKYLLEMAMELDMQTSLTFIGTTRVSWEAKYLSNLDKVIKLG
jgi:hypothetical protein